MTRETAMVIQALVHGGTPTLAIIVAYLLDRKEHKKMHVLLNGGLQEKIQKAVASALKERKE